MALAIERVAGAVGRAHVALAVRSLGQRGVDGVGALVERGFVLEVHAGAVAAPDVVAGLTHDGAAVLRVPNAHAGRVRPFVEPLGLELDGQQLDGLADLPKQALGVAQLVHVFLLARAEPDNHAGVKQPHPGGDGHAQPRNTHVAGLLTQPVLTGTPAGYDELHELGLLGEQQEGHDGVQAALDVAGVKRAHPVGDELDRVVGVEGFQAGQDAGVGAQALEAFGALGPDGRVVGGAPVEGGGQPPPPSIRL